MGYGTGQYGFGNFGLEPEPIIYKGPLRAITTLAQRVYNSMAPVTVKDNGDLKMYTEAISQMTSEIELLCRDDADGNPGWSIILDVDRCPEKYLPWLAQIAGSTLPSGLNEADKRLWIKSTYGWKRGTFASVTNAPKPYLTGSKTVYIRERTPDAYSFFIGTLTDETPDAAAVEAAIKAAKPAGLNYIYSVNDGQIYETIYDDYATYQDLFEAYLTYEGVLEKQLGT